MPITYLQPKGVNTEALVQKALLPFFDWRQRPCFWNSGLLRWESDFLTLTRAQYMTEVEIKTDWQDWKNDHKKDKWCKPQYQKDWQWIKHFYYAVPKELYDKHGLPETMPETAGLLVLAPHKVFGKPPVVTTLREATANPKAKPITEPMLKRLYVSSYYKLAATFLK